MPSQADSDCLDPALAWLCGFVWQACEKELAAGWEGLPYRGMILQAF
tara:strand:- start:317 stop:457 length:141 start_codon:yes stop_codon:yes gene_type:complete